MIKSLFKTKILTRITIALGLVVIIFLIPIITIQQDNRVSAAVTCLYTGRGAPEEGIIREYPDLDRCPVGLEEIINEPQQIDEPAINTPNEQYSLPLSNGLCWDGTNPSLIGTNASVCPPQPDMSGTDTGGDGAVDEAECTAAGNVWVLPAGSAQYVCQTPPPEEQETEGEVELVSACYEWGIGWVVCPIINTLGKFGDFLIQQFITPFLQTTPINISDGNNNIFKVWSTFRVIANIILVAALIFVIFGNAIGSGFAEAYLAKKSLPRIFIAAILINTSIYIAAGMIDITNVVGRSIGHLMMAPFSFNGLLLFNIGGGAATAVGTLSLAAIGGGVWLTVTAGSGVIPFLLLFVLLPAVVAMLAVFVTLVLRQGIILFLVIISPVAFALFALPNTAKYFEKWWSMFLKTLLVYPIVMIVIAMSNILSVLVNEANPDAAGAKMIKDLVSIFLMLAPLFLIPFAFKMAGGITGQAFGAISGMGKKGVNAIKGDPNLPTSLGRKTKARAGEGLTRAQMRIVQPGDPTKAGLFRRSIGRAAGWIGNPDQRSADYSKAAAERQARLTAYGNDPVIYAAAGYEEDGKYFNSKDEEISKNLYKRGKRLYGSTNAEISQALNYTLVKTQGDASVGAVRKAFEMNAIERNWTQDEVDKEWKSVTYDQKDRIGSEYYSAPVVQRDTNGRRTTGIKFTDVGESSKTYGKMISEYHKPRDVSAMAKVSGQDVRVMADHQSWVQGNLDLEYTHEDAVVWNRNNEYESEEHARTAALKNYIMTDEIINALSMERRDGSQQVIAGTNEAREVIRSIKANRVWEVERSTENGQESYNKRDLVHRPDKTDRSVITRRINDIPITGAVDRPNVPK